MTRMLGCTLLASVFAGAVCFSLVVCAQETSPKPEAKEGPIAVTQRKPGMKLEIVKGNPQKVYIGDRYQWRDIGCIQARLVFDKIRWYNLARERTEKGSARYWIYMTKANKLFQSALRRFSKTTNYDLICEKKSQLVAVYILVDSEDTEKPSEGEEAEPPAEAATEGAAEPAAETKQVKVLIGYYEIPEKTQELIKSMSDEEEPETGL